MFYTHNSSIRNFVRRAIMVFASLAMIIGLSACSDESKVAKVDGKSGSTNVVKAQIVLKVGYDGVAGEPLDLGMQRWKEELENRTHGRISLELYPSASLGEKNSILERMQQGEHLATVVDGASLYTMGAYDLGVLYGPYLFNNWDEALRLVDSKWTKAQFDKLSREHNIRVISFDWCYGVRHLLTTRPITKFSELQGLRIRTPMNDIQYKTWQTFGTEPTKMEATKVLAALRNKEIDAVERPIATIYAGGFYKAAPYLLKTAHVYDLSGVAVSNAFWQSLSTSDQEIFKQSCDRAAKFFNVVQMAVEHAAYKQLIAAGVTVTEPSPKFFREINTAARSFYGRRDVSEHWTPGLYYQTVNAKHVPWSYYTGNGLDPETSRIKK